jgi:hypothetical protein
MISIDTIYQRVLALANKEQRGYITPQEFNLFANQAQMDIFEQYFYDLNQLLRIRNNSDEYANIRDNLQEKITIFERTNTGSGSINASDVYRLGTIRVDINGVFVEAEEVHQKELRHMLQGPLTKPTSKRPVYHRRNATIVIYPENVDFTYDYVKSPHKVNWGYVVVNDKAMYDPSTTLNFELHRSEEGELTNRILGLAGITLKQPDLSQAAAQAEAVKVQQEKQ